MTSLRFDWFLPTSGDSRDLVGGGHGSAVTASGRDRPATLSYLAQIARAAEQVGFEALLTPTGAWCEDAWVTTSLLHGLTERIRFLVAFRPGLISPTLAAQMATTFQNLTDGRLELNVVTGGEDVEQREYGDTLDKHQRYVRTGEFLDVVRRLWSGEEVTVEGQHVRVEGARLVTMPFRTPSIYFGGSSAPAIDVAARQADVYLTWGEPPEAVGEKVEHVRSAAAALGREVRFGVRLHVINRDTTEQAWAEARRLLDGLDPATVRSVQEVLGRSGSEGQQRMLALHGGTRDGLEISPNLWAGVGLVRGGAGTALVGSHEEVADRIEDYAAVGIEEFVLSGYPHLETVYTFGEGVLPVLERRGRWTRPVSGSGARGR